MELLRLNQLQECITKQKFVVPISETGLAQLHGRRATFSPVGRAPAVTAAIQPGQPTDSQPFGNFSIIRGDECCDVLQICQSCLGVDYRAVHAAIRERTSAAE